MSQEYRSKPTETSGMPGGIPYIIANEMAERFSFYGMKGILSIFMVQYLWLMGDVPGEQMTQTEATKHYHSFTGWVYFTPFLGALLADIFFGKYRIIIWLSLVYCMGHAALALMGVAGSAGWWLFIGLALIVMGSGGIKPCVSAHVGDQFGPKNQHLLTRIFNWFYCAINLGSFVSTLLTPWLLEWYGPHWAFGVPGALMALATLFFWMGRRKFIHVPAGGRKFTKEIFSKVGIGAILRLIPLYLFVAFFWALFDQTGSSWVFQSQDMNRHFLGFELLPSQIQSANPVMILILVPLISLFVYPAIHKIFPLTPLRKVGLGLFTTVISFAIISGIQVAIAGGAQPNIGWQLLAYLVITIAEVMVSIVCLEYSYTQAPKTMKSVIMAVFFFSVWFGNLFTSWVNGVIEVENPTKGFLASAKEETTSHAGFDGKEDTADDIIFELKEGKSVIKTLPSRKSLDRAATVVEQWAGQNDNTLPTSDDAEVLLKGLTDAWGNPLNYTRLASRTARIASSGPDQEGGTQWDIGYILKTKEPKKAEKAAVQYPKEKKLTWLEKRKALLGIKDDTTSDKPVTRIAFTGGQPKLEGPSYYWFFTGLMFAASILFVPYAMCVKERSFLDPEEK